MGGVLWMRGVGVDRARFKKVWGGLVQICAESAHVGVRGGLVQICAESAHVEVGNL